MIANAIEQSAFNTNLSKKMFIQNEKIKIII